MLLLGSSAAAAKPSVQPPPGAAAAQDGPKDYSRNAATGDFRPQLRTSSLAGTTSPVTSTRAGSGADGDATPWAAVALGFAGGSLAAGVTMALAGRARRWARTAS
jgi:hypothetical protein